LFVLFTLFGGFGVVLHLLMWIFVPLEQPYPMLGDGTLG
jgi:phage shock protein PspC (stress-responsive transcriptional regulator)